MKTFTKTALLAGASSAISRGVDGVKSLLPETSSVLNNGIETGPGFYNKKNAGLSAETDPANKSRKTGVYPVLEYPLGLSDPTSENAGPMMVITGIKYIRRKEGRLLSSKFNGTRPADENDRSTDIQFVIRLPMPAGINSAISGSYKDHEAWGNLIKQVQSGELANDSDAAMGYLRQIYKNQTQGDGKWSRLAGTLLDSVSGGLDVKNVLSNMIGSIARDEGIAINSNAKVTAQYEGPDVQSHNFSFNMVPTNQNESIVIREIIQLLQEHSTGESKFATSSLIVDYPSLFNIEFVTNRIIDKSGQVQVKTNKIKGVHDIPDSYITNIDATFNPDAPRIMSDNSPASYNLSIGFKNTAALTRKDLRALSTFEQEGYEDPTTPEDQEGRSFIEDVISSSRLDIF